MMQRGDQISVQEVAIYRTLRAAECWLTNREIEAAVGKIGDRTVRLHTKRFAALGLLEVQKVYPGYRYRWAGRVREARAVAYQERLKDAADVIGVL